MPAKIQLMDVYLKGEFRSKAIGDVLTEMVLSSAADFLTETVMCLLYIIFDEPTLPKQEGYNLSMPHFFGTSI